MATWRIFTAGWRVFFMAAGLWAVVSMAIWVIWLAIHAMGGMAGDMGLSMPPYQWHAHEMIFGFAAAALGGFFLTAVPNWTGARAAPGRFIAIVAALWLAGRLALWLSGILPPLMVAVIDLAFLPVLGAKILGQLLKRPKPQNMMFLGVLSLIWMANLLVHLEWLGLADTQAQGMRGGVLGVCAMIAVLGGRITPAFTRNVLQRENAARLPVSHPVLDRLGAVLSLGTALAALTGLPDMITGILATGAGIVAALRLAGWRGAASLGQPILLALHLGYAMLALGLALWGAALIGLGSEVGALHVLGIGAVGGMTLAVMSRASLGHSGRPLIAPWPVATAYALMPLAAGLRWAGSNWPGDFYYGGVICSGLIWILAFALYLAALWPVFLGPRLAATEAGV